jgi:hypothetical protein
MPKSWHSSQPSVKYFELTWGSDPDDRPNLYLHAVDETDALSGAEAFYAEHPHFDFPGRTSMPVRVNPANLMPYTMRVGDLVEVIAVPDDLPARMGTQALFEACRGRVFPIADIKDELVELEVGDVVEKESFMYSIWIEISYVSVRQKAP